MMRLEPLSGIETPTLQTSVGEILECARRVIELTNDLCVRVPQEDADSLTKGLQERDMLLVRLVELRDQHGPTVSSSENRSMVQRAVQSVIGEMGTSDCLLMERLQKRKQEAFVALVDAQKQQQITHYVQ
jgi:hypothetical protein